MNARRNAAAACVLNHVAYVFCGEGSSTNLNSIEKLSLVNITEETQGHTWEMITPDDTLSPRYYPAVVPLNDTEIAIFSGYNNAYLSDIVVFDTVNDSLMQVVPS